MSFLKNLFNRKKPEESPVVAPTPAPQPAEPAPAPVAAPAAPAPAPTSSESIRKALDTMSQKLISSPDQLMITTGMRLQELMREVDDAPCTFEGVDDAIVGAVRQMECLCRTCNAEKIKSDLSVLKDAIAARGNTEQNTDKFSPTMKTHYYKLLLIDLRGRLKALDESVAEKQEFIDKVNALPAEQRSSYRELKRAYEDYIEDSDTEKTYLEKQKAACEAGILLNKDLINAAGEFQTQNLGDILDPLFEQSKKALVRLEQMDRDAILFEQKYGAMAEEKMLGLAKHGAAEAERARLEQENEEKRTAARNMGKRQAAPQEPIQETKMVGADNQAVEETTPEMSM